MLYYALKILWCYRKCDERLKLFPVNLDLILVCMYVRLYGPDKWKLKKNRAFQSRIFLSPYFVESVACFINICHCDGFRPQKTQTRHYYYGTYRYVRISVHPFSLYQYVRTGTVQHGTGTVSKRKSSIHYVRKTK